MLQNAGSEEAKNIIHVCVHDKATHTAFHVCAAQVNHLECVESFMEFSFIRLGKKVSHGILQKLSLLICCYVDNQPAVKSVAIFMFFIEILL